MVSYNGSNYKPYAGGRKLIPEGDCEVVITDAEETLSRSGNPVLKITMQPVEQEYERQYLWHHIVLNNEYTEENIGRLLDSLDYNPYESLQLDPSSLHGQTLTVHVFHDVYQGEKQAKMKYPLCKYTLLSAVTKSQNQPQEQANPDNAGNCPF